MQTVSWCTLIVVIVAILFVTARCLYRYLVTVLCSRIGCPDGWKVVRYGDPKIGEFYLYDGDPLCANFDGGYGLRWIVRPKR